MLLLLSSLVSYRTATPVVVLLLVVVVGTVERPIIASTKIECSEFRLTYERQLKVGQLEADRSVIPRT